MSRRNKGDTAPQRAISRFTLAPYLVACRLAYSSATRFESFDFVIDDVDLRISN